MDSSNYANIMKLKSGITNSQVKMMRSFDPDGPNEDVPDPYYGGINGFENRQDIIDERIKTNKAQIKEYSETKTINTHFDITVNMTDLEWFRFSIKSFSICKFMLAWNDVMNRNHLISNLPS